MAINRLCELGRCSRVFAVLGCGNALLPTSSSPTRRDTVEGLVLPCPWGTSAARHCSVRQQTALSSKVHKLRGLNKSIKKRLMQTGKEQHLTLIPCLPRYVHQRMILWAGEFVQGLVKAQFPAPSHCRMQRSFTLHTVLCCRAR